MLLRWSGDAVNEEADLAIVNGAGDGDAGIPHGRTLAAFAEAVLGEDDAALAEIRGDLIAAVGPEGAVDAAAVAAVFSKNDRMADATGIPLDTGGADLRTALGVELGIGHFTGAPAT